MGSQTAQAFSPPESPGLKGHAWRRLGAVMLGAVMLGAVMLGAVMLGAVMLGLCFA